MRISDWSSDVCSSDLPEETAAALLAPIAADVRRGDRAVWISAFELRALTSRIEELLERRDRGEALPLLGVPFGVKDNIDVAGLATTAGCPGFSYEPGRSATDRKSTRLNSSH